MIKAVRQNKKTSKWEYDYKDLKGKRKIKKALIPEMKLERALVKHYEELNKGINPINKKTNIKEEANYISGSRKYKLQTFNI